MGRRLYGPWTVLLCFFFLNLLSVSFLRLVFCFLCPPFFWAQLFRVGRKFLPEDAVLRVVIVGPALLVLLSACFSPLLTPTGSAVLVRALSVCLWRALGVPVSSSPVVALLARSLVAPVLFVSLLPYPFSILSLWVLVSTFPFVHFGGGVNLPKCPLRYGTVCIVLVPWK